MENNAQRSKAKECSLPKVSSSTFHSAISWESCAGCTGLSGAHQELADPPLTSQHGGTKAPHAAVAFPICGTQIGEGDPCQEPAAAPLCCKRKHVCSCMCVCMALDREEDEVMIPTLNPGQLTFPWRFLIKANVCPTKKASLGG